MSDLQSERRASVRRNIRVPVTCWMIEGGKPSGKYFSVVNKDLSESGLSFESKALYPLGTPFLCEIHLPGRKEPVRGKLKVAHIQSLAHDTYLIGAAFTDLTPADKMFIASRLESMNLYSLLDRMQRTGASDMHLTVGRPPILRVQKKLQFMGAEKIDEGQVRAMFYPLLQAAQIDFFETNKELDFAFSPDFNSRYRVNLHFQRGYLEATVRNIPAKIPNFNELGLPVKEMERFCRERSGLVLIAGMVGSGKTTTLAAMIEHINANTESVIVTIEDPIEYVFTSKRSIVKQRELGSDTRSFASALKYSLRQDPDIIVIGELLDNESVMSALAAADTGHMVIATVHAANTIQTLEKIVGMFPVEHAPNICKKLASSLVGVVYQLLVPGRSGKLVLATEVLLNNPAVKNLIGTGQFKQISTCLQTGASQGMHTLDSALAYLHAQRQIDLDLVKPYLKQD